ncbi:MAG TPA: hypothetical protein VI636_03130 [Candidatus Angelobacter sp.]
MTIIAGFRSENGIVVCADTQETSGPSKRTVPKLRFEARGMWTDAPLAIAFCGSGYGPLIDKLTAECWKAAEPLGCLDDVCEIIEKTIKKLYKEYRSIYGASECPTAELIYGVKAKEGNKLFSANGPIVNEKPEYYSTGVGYYMADFLASRMYRPYLRLHQCVILAAYILFQAKEHVDGCGGDSHIAVLRDDGESGLVDATRIEAITEMLKLFDAGCGEISLKVADLDLDEESLAKELNDLSELLKHYRELQRNEIKKHDEFGLAAMFARIAGGGKPPIRDSLGMIVRNKPSDEI